MPFLGKEPAFDLAATTDLGADIVTEAKMANDAIGLAELKAGTDGELITWDASGNPTTVAAGTSGHFLKSQGAGSVPVFAAAGGVSQATLQATTSGTSWTFTGIPSGTKRFYLVFRNVSSAETGITIKIELGTSSGLETSGYVSGGKYHEGTAIAGQVNATDGFVLREQYGATNSINGFCEFVLADAATYSWVMNGQNHHVGTGHGFTAGGKTLSAELTQLKVSGFTGDAGYLNVIFG